MQTEAFYRARDKALLKNQRIIKEMHAEEQSPEIGTIALATVKPWTCRTCGTRHSRAADVIHHHYSVHFDKNAE